MVYMRKVALNATRQQVWEAISTGPGLSSWYVPHEVEAKKGGRAVADFGGGTYATGVVLVYEPGKRIVYGAGDAAPGVGEKPVPLEEQVTLEFWIPRSTEDDVSWKLLKWVRPGPTKTKAETVLYFRQTGFGEGNTELFDAGWSMHFHVLQQYFDHFADKSALTTAALALHPIGREEAWATMRNGVGLPERFNVGQKVGLAVPGLRPIEGIVTLVMSGYPLDGISVRNEEEIFQMAADEQCGGFINRYQYVSNPAPLEAQRVKESALMQDWLQEQFAR